MFARIKPHRRTKPHVLGCAPFNLLIYRHFTLFLKPHDLTVRLSKCAPFFRHKINDLKAVRFLPLKGVIKTCAFNGAHDFTPAPETCRAKVKEF